tara:strand:- start:4358 stop:5143 length:786 start_codon:yes stop_codon:yes gene_type:complete
MSEIYPKNNIGKDSPLDVDRVNENFREVIQEVNGNLSESNFKYRTLDQTHVKDDAVFRFHKFYEVGSVRCKGAHHATTMTGAGTYEQNLPRTGGSGFSATAGGVVAVPINNKWTTIARLDVITRTGLLWIMGSWQQSYYVDGEETATGFGAGSARSDSGNLNTRDRYRFFPGLQYCLSIDGTRVAETTVGGLDAADDIHGEAYALWQAPFVTDMVLPVSAGNHVITIEARQPIANTNYPQFSQSHSFYTIASRELIALEMT